MPRLPPVPISPQTRLRARFWPGVGNSVATFFQSHSSSSATSWARPVSVPWPISERAMRITQVSSGLTTTQALTSGPARRAPVAAAASTRTADGSPSARPPPAAAAEPTMNCGARDLVRLFAANARSSWRTSSRSRRWTCAGLARPASACRPPGARPRGCAGRCRSGRCWSSRRRCPCRWDSGFFASSAAAAMICPDWQ